MGQLGRQQGNPSYKLDIAFRREYITQSNVEKGRDPIQLNASQILDFDIVLDINKLLPSFKLRIQDSAGFFSQLVPFDRDFSRMLVQLGGPVEKTNRKEDLVDYYFDIYKRNPLPDKSYAMEGLVHIDNLFNPNHIRSFSGTIKSTLETIGAELGVDEYDISPSLNYSKIILQPGWTNGQLLKSLTEYLIGSSGESGFYCFIKCWDNKKTLVFKSVNDIVKQVPKYHFNFTDTPFYDSKVDRLYYPILNYEMVDSNKILGITGSRRQRTLYYDWDTSTLKQTDVKTIDGTNGYPALTQYFLIDKEDKEEESVFDMDCGRSNTFSGDFTEVTKNKLFGKLTNLSKLWITTYGLVDAYPGEVFQIMNLSVLGPGTELSQVYQGFWITEKVVHRIGMEYQTMILLTRSGINTSADTTLLSAPYTWSNK